MAILAAVLIPTVTNKIKDAKKATAKQDCTATASALASAVIDNIANGTALPTDLTPAADAYTAPTADGTFIYGSLTNGFVVVTKTGDDIYWAQVTAKGSAKPLQETGTPTIVAA